MSDRHRQHRRKRSMSEKKDSRPGTSGRPPSRQAWQDSEVYNIDLDASQENSGAPGAMVAEMLDKDALRVVSKNQAIGDQGSPGIGAKIGKFMSSIWMTKYTHDAETDRELFVKTTLRELIIYMIFLVNLCIVTFGMTSSNMFYYTRIMTELFIDAQTHEYFKTFRGIVTPDDFWAYTYGPFLDGLYWEKWYDGRNVSDDNFAYVIHENKLLGLPRMRLLRVRDDSCVVPDAFEREIKDCFSPYGFGVEDKEPFGFGDRNSSAWVYHDEDVLESQKHWGKMGLYGGGGYVQDLALTKDKAIEILDKLRLGRWIDRATRVLFVDFSVYNANINLFSIVKLVVEFPATGGILPSFNIRTVKLIRYVTAFDFFVLACEGVFVAFIVYYMIEEILEIKNRRCSYFKEFWNILDVTVILIAVCCIGFSAYRQLMVDSKLDKLLEDGNVYANFEFLGFAQTRFNDAVAVMVFFAWIKIFKYISFNKTMNQLSSTLSRCAKDVGGFAIMFFIFFFAYAQLGYLVFGTQVKDFSTFYDSVFTLLRTILGDFNFHELEQANRVLGPIFFITYVFFVFFVLLNMFLAIINDTYAEVKAEIAQQKDEFQIADYFRRGYNNMMRKLNLRKDKIMDIQQALRNADVDNSDTIDFEEWRTELRRRGYADQQIEALFARYDTDGDRQLGRSEMEAMERDLDLEKAVVEAEMGERPETRQSDQFSDFDNVSVAAAGRRHRTAGDSGAATEHQRVLAQRVDRMEHSIGSIVSKIDSVLVRLEKMEKVKMNHQMRMADILEEVHRTKGSDEEKLSTMQEKLQGELERFDRDTGERVQSSGNQSVHG